MGRLVVGAIVVVVVLIGAGAGIVLFMNQPSPPTVATAKTSSEAPPREQPATNAEATSQASSSSEEPKGKAPLLQGTSKDDALVGTDGNDRIYAASETAAEGSDSVDAGAGDDRIYADAGDSVQGGPGHDELIVRTSAPFSLMLAGTGIEETWGGVGDDVFDGTGVSDPLTLRGGLGKDRLTGGGGADLFYGGDGDDVLVGGAGNDTLKGEAGTDVLTGGKGADAFIYTKFDGSTDTITDYNLAEGDTVTAASFAKRGNDTVLLDAAGQTLYILKDYDAATMGVGRRK
ncbi:MAG: calcium-binding protein [Devosia sp.]